MKRFFAICLLLGAALLLTGCGALLTGSDKIGGGSKGTTITPDISDLQIFYVETYYSYYRVETFTAFSSYKCNLVKLHKKSDGSYKNSSTDSISNSNNGFGKITVSSFSDLDDAYMLGAVRYSGSGTSTYTMVSNVVPKSDYTQIRYNYPSTWKYRNYCFSSSSSIGSIQSYKPSSYSASWSSSYRYLWVELTDNKWMCIGYFSTDPLS